MTSELRERLRVEIDAEKRRRMTEARGVDLTTSIAACKSCGGDHDLYTKGCATCTNRRWNRTRRKNAARRALEAAQARERRTLQGRPAGSFLDGCEPSESPAGRGTLPVARNHDRRD